MRAVVQRVNHARVEVDEVVTGSINQGFLVLLGIAENDTEADLDWLVKKVIGLRVFSDEAGKMNKSLVDVHGAILLVSQFTLHASTKKGNRPSFIQAAKPEKALQFYEAFKHALEAQLQQEVATGIFGAHMKITLENDGPVTILFDTENKE
ncbi:MAG: D-tyrosyl-tRNA(Tyr) deacylase [Saprospiraceae bacterium]|nr:D-tyrosyl-tRNA(Tyr) deacylase [Saprospiraceae bacterium]